MKNKKGLMLGIEIGALIIALGVVIAVMLLLKKDKASSENQKLDKSTTSNVIDKLEGYNAKCEMNNSDNDANFTEKHIENIQVSGEQAIKSQSTVVVTYPSLEEYDAGKEVKYEGKVIYNDENLSVEYTVGEEVDYTRNIDGEDIILKYSDLKTSLEELGYSCSLNS